MWSNNDVSKVNHCITNEYNVSAFHEIIVNWCYLDVTKFYLFNNS